MAGARFLPQYNHATRPARRLSSRMAGCPMRCAYCNAQVDEDDLTVDHVQALSRGGPNSTDNIVPACGPCNQAKGNKTLDEWGPPYRRQIEGIVLACLRTGMGIIAAWMSLQDKGIKTGVLSFEHIVRGLAERDGWPGIPWECWDGITERHGFVHATVPTIEADNNIWRELVARAERIQRGEVYPPRPKLPVSAY